MSKINLIGVFFLRAVFFCEDTTPSVDILSIDVKKSLFGIEKFVEVSVNCFFGERGFLTLK